MVSGEEASARTSAGTVYLWGISPYGYKVLLAAAHKGLRLDVRIASFPDCAAARKRTGKRKTPFLVDGDEWITDSTSIWRRFEERCGGPSLLPRDPKQRAECLLLEDWADEGLGRSAEVFLWMGGDRFPRIAKMVADEQVHPPSRMIFRLARPYMRRVWTKRVEGHGGLDATRALLCSQLDLIERRLDGAPWLFGDVPSIADYAIAAQLANLVRFSCSEDLDRRPATAALVRRAVAPLAWAEGVRS